MKCPKCGTEKLFLTPDGTCGGCPKEVATAWRRGPKSRAKVKPGLKFECTRKTTKGA